MLCYGDSSCQPGLHLNGLPSSIMFPKMSKFSFSQSVDDLTSSSVMCGLRLRTWYYVPGLRLVSKRCWFRNFNLASLIFMYMPNVWEHLQPVRITWYIYIWLTFLSWLTWRNKKNISERNLSCRKTQWQWLASPTFDFDPISDEHWLPFKLGLRLHLVSGLSCHVVLTNGSVIKLLGVEKGRKRMQSEKCWWNESCIHWLVFTDWYSHPEICSALVIARDFASWYCNVKPRTVLRYSVWH